jgi:hypothetical protein
MIAAATPAIPRANSGGRLPAGVTALDLMGTLTVTFTDSDVANFTYTRRFEQAW